MPKTKKGKKGKKGGKGKKGKKGKLKAAAEKEEILAKTKTILKSYPSLCSTTGSSVGSIVYRALKQCVEDEKPLVKCIIDPQISSNETRRPLKNKQGTKKGATPAVPVSSSSTIGGADRQQAPALPSTRLSPMLHALLEVDYIYLRCIHAWVVQLDEGEMAELSKFMKTKIGHEIRVLELIRNNISTWSLCRFCQTLSTSQLVQITLDYNRIDDVGIQSLCTGLHHNLHLTSLSLNYCNLSSSSGDHLGILASSTQLRYLSVQGNRLRAKGVSSLVQHFIAISQSNENMPLLAKLFLQDNEIDGCGNDGIRAPIHCMELMRRWISSCKVIEEVRLDGNLIGDSAAREVLIGLKCRKEAGHPPIALSVTNCIATELFTDIKSITASKTGKKGKSKKKGKKKKKS